MTTPSNHIRNSELDLEKRTLPHLACLVQQQLDLHLPLDQDRDAREHGAVVLHVAGVAATQSDPVSTWKQHRRGVGIVLGLCVWHGG